MQVFVQFELFKSIIDRKQILSPREAIGGQLQKIQASGKMFFRNGVDSTVDVDETNVLMIFRPVIDVVSAVVIFAPRCSVTFHSLGDDADRTLFEQAYCLHIGIMDATKVVTIRQFNHLPAIS